MSNEHISLWDPFAETKTVNSNEYVPVAIKIKPSYKVAIAIMLIGFGIIFVIFIAEMLDLADDLPNWAEHLGTLAMVMIFVSGAFCALTKTGDPDDEIKDQFGLLFHLLALSLGTKHRHFIKPLQVGLKRGRKSHKKRFAEIRAKFDDIAEKNTHYPKIPDGQVTELAKDISHHQRKHPSVMYSDPDAVIIINNLEEFMGPSMAIQAPFNPTIGIWGKHENKPFWLALEGTNGDFRRPDISEAEMSFENLSQAAATSTKTATINFLIGLPLTRNTEVQAMLTGDIKIIKLKNDKHLESIEFNDLFKVNLIKGKETKLYQSLTPATQTSLTALHKDYSTEAYIKKDQLFLRGLIGLDYDTKDKTSIQHQHQVLGARLRSILDQSLKLARYIT